MLVALGDLVAALEFLVAPVVHAERLADIIDAVLTGGRIVAAGGFVADRVRVLPFRVDVAARECGTGFGVLIEPGAQLVVTRAGRRDEPVVRESRLPQPLVVCQLAAFAGERGRRRALDGPRGPRGLLGACRPGGAARRLRFTDGLSRRSRPFRPPWGARRFPAGSGGPPRRLRTSPAAPFAGCLSFRLFLCRH